MNCEICGEEIEGGPFTIVTPEYRIGDVCGTCMNHYAYEEFDELEKRLARSSKPSASTGSTEGTG